MKTKNNIGSQSHILNMLLNGLFTGGNGKFEIQEKSLIYKGNKDCERIQALHPDMHINCNKDKEQ